MSGKEEMGFIKVLPTILDLREEALFPVTHINWNPFNVK